MNAITQTLEGHSSTPRDQSPFLRDLSKGPEPTALRRPALVAACERARSFTALTKERRFQTDKDTHVTGNARKLLKT